MLLFLHCSSGGRFLKSFLFHFRFFFFLVLFCDFFCVFFFFGNAQVSAFLQRHTEKRNGGGGHVIWRWMDVVLCASTVLEDVQLLSLSLLLLLLWGCKLFYGTRFGYVRILTPQQQQQQQELWEMSFWWRPRTLSPATTTTTATHTARWTGERVYIQHDTSLCHSGQFNASQKEISTYLCIYNRETYEQLQ